MIKLLWTSPWRVEVISQRHPKDGFFDEKGCIAYFEKVVRTSFKSYHLKKTEADGGTWIRGTVDGWMSISAFMHPTKRHRSGVYCGRYGYVEPNSQYNLIAEPGDWAVAFGNATYCGLSYPVYKTIE